MSLFEELKRRNVFRVGAAYVVTAWLLIQVADTIFPLFGFDETPARIVVIVLIGGFIPALIFSWVYELTSEGLRKEGDVDRSAAVTRTKARKFDLAIIGLLSITLLVIVGKWLLESDLRWAQEAAIPAIEMHVADREWEAAYRLARQVESRVGDDELLADVWPTFSWLMPIPSEPPGATVYRRPYESPDAEWETLGQTPLDGVRIPFGLSVIRLELGDRPPTIALLGGQPGVSRRTPSAISLREKRPLQSGVSFFRPRTFQIESSESAPADMLRVPGAALRRLDGIVADFRSDWVPFEDFLIDRFEVTNREFKDFVDAGGYERQDLWVEDFVHDGQSISWEGAMKLMVDASGRPGPATWIAGTYPEGMADHPVAGVSWYEADAYARFVGKELPTYLHWRRAIGDGALPWILPASNLAANSAAPVGEYRGISWTGALDMAGNVREWCYNESGDGRIIIGGAYSDPHYVVHESILDAAHLPPMDRSPVNGFRLAKTADEPAAKSYIRARLPDEEEFVVPEPVPDAVFNAYRNNFNYDDSPLNATIESSQVSDTHTRFHVTFDTPYGDDRAGLYLYLPGTGKPPFQTILFWGGASWRFVDSVDVYKTPLEFLLQNGRAVVIPVMKGTFERRTSSEPVSWATIAGRDLAIEQVKDMRRAIDYLETRDDIDADTLGYYGLSWGGRVGAIALAVEKRLKAGVLNTAGLQHLQMPEISVVNFLPRVTQPVLQMNGIYDTDFRFETSAKPFFELLGTPAERKKHVAEPTGHFVSFEVNIGETLAWFDEYLGKPSK
jgi:hypothetical protein